MLRCVDIGGLMISSDPEDTLISYGLGSCMGLAIYDPVARLGGLIHAKVPTRETSRPEIGGGPAECADFGTMTLLQQMLDAGARKDRMIVAIAGCGNSIKAITGDIGHRNYLITRKVLWQNAVFVHAKDIGGEKPRTIQLSIATGAVTIHTLGKSHRLG